jgi:DNA-binding PadR family transcriptional regulator
MDGPMSGSEIVDKIEECTGWRPSPGSIYPLLSHMQENGLIKPYEDEDPTVKRFELTELGRSHRDELHIYKEQMESRNNVFRRMFWRLHVEMPEDLYNSLNELLVTLENAYTVNKGDSEFSRKMVDVLDSTIATLKEIGS